MSDVLTVVLEISPASPKVKRGTPRIAITVIIDNAKATSCIFPNYPEEQSDETIIDSTIDNLRRSGDYKHASILEDAQRARKLSLRKI